MELLSVCLAWNHVCWDSWRVQKANLEKRQQFLKGLNIEFSHDPATLLHTDKHQRNENICSHRLRLKFIAALYITARKHKHPDVHCWGLEKQTVPYLFNGLSFGSKGDSNADMCMEGPWKMSSKWKKEDNKAHKLYHSIYPKCLE